MFDITQLSAIAFKAELIASRRLVRQTGISDEQALRQTLEASAGEADLAALVTQRMAQLAVTAQRLAAREHQKTLALAARHARHDGPPTRWRAWFDGSAHPNPGSCGIGAVLTGPDGERIEISRAAGYGNSSEAEYLALIAVLEAAVEAGADELTVYGDSQSVIVDAQAPTGAGAPSLCALQSRTHVLLRQIAAVSLRWVPRHKNPQADALSQRAVIGSIDH